MKRLSFTWFPLKAESGNQLHPPPNTPTSSQPTIFPECAAYFLCQGGVLDSKFHQMSKTLRQKDYISKDVEDGGVSGGLKASWMYLYSYDDSVFNPLVSSQVAVKNILGKNIQFACKEMEAKNRQFIWVSCLFLQF